MDEPKNKLIRDKITYYAGVLATVSTEASQVMASAWHAPEHDDLSEKRLKQHKLWQGLMIASSGVLSLIILATASFFALAHGSLAPVYLGSIQIKPTDPNTYIAQQVKDKTRHYKLLIQYPDQTKKEFSLSKMGVAVDDLGSAEQAKKALNKSFLGRLKWWQPINLPLITKINTVKLDSFLTKDATQSKVAPVNAGISLEGGKTHIHTAKDGRGAAIKDAMISVPRAVSYMQSEPMFLVRSTLKPAIGTNDVKPSRDKVDAMLKQKISLNIDGNLRTVGPSDIAGWIDFTPVPSAKTIDVTVNSGKVLEYINQVSSYYISPVHNRTILKTANGEIVLEEGNDGTDILNKADIASELTKKLSKGQGMAAKMDVQHVKAKTTSITGSHGKWIEANVTTKRMYAYEGDKLIKTFLISAGAPATPTVIGNYRVYAKYVSQDMRGSNTDGSRYFQPDVPYVLYFYGSYAIHGNYWRPSSWFGNINSSHGCLGVTPGDGAWIYDWAPIGTPVITHY